MTSEYNGSERTAQVWRMANIVCELCGKPRTCKECARRNWCGTIASANKLWDAGYRQGGQPCDKDGLTVAMD